MAISVLAPNEMIPVDRHRVCVFILPESFTEEFISARANAAGCRISFITEVVDAKLPDEQVAYGCWIEPAVNGVTPQRLQESLGALRLTVNREAPSVAVEFFHDAYGDIWMVGSGGGIAFEVAEDDETLPSRTWFFARGQWLTIVPSAEQLQESLDSSGIQVIAKGRCIPESADPSDQSFIFNTGSKVRTPKEIKELVGAAGLIVNRFAVKGYIADRCNNEEDLGEDLADLSKQAQDTVQALMDFLKAAGKASEVAFKVAKWGLIGGLVVGGIWLGKKGYDAYQGSK